MLKRGYRFKWSYASITGTSSIWSTIHRIATVNIRDVSNMAAIMTPVTVNRLRRQAYMACIIPRPIFLSFSRIPHL